MNKKNVFEMISFSCFLNIIRRVLQGDTNIGFTIGYHIGHLLFSTETEIFAKSDTLRVIQILKY